MKINELRELEKTGKYLFHGSSEYINSVFVPRQAYNDKAGKRLNDDKPGVHSTPILDIAIFMATVTRKNAPDNFHSRFHTEGDEIKLSFNRDTSEQINDDSSGYVYIFNIDDFKKRSDAQYISYNEVESSNVVEVKFSDISIPVDVFED
ncbi:hypothetical protein GW764_03100 [Candidatus Parcubacteria bacterium]|nr:hypothetical protein [Candidatus Parcubacteria bacterium]